MNKSELHSTLDERIGVMAAKLGAFSAQQQSETLKVQSRYIALDALQLPTKGSNGRWLAFSDVADDKKWESTVQSKSPEAVKQALDNAQAHLRSGKPVNGNVPAYGEVADGLKFIDKDVKNALLAAQAGERMLREAEYLGGAASLDEKNHTMGPILERAKQNYRAFDGDPDYLKAAQKLENEGAKQVKAALDNKQPSAIDAEKLKAGARDAFSASADALEKAGKKELATQIRSLNDDGQAPEKSKGKPIKPTAPETKKDDAVEKPKRKFLTNKLGHGVHSLSPHSKREELWKKMAAEEGKKLGKAGANSIVDAGNVQAPHAGGQGKPEQRTV